MASRYWLKLYHEILHDPKMGTLSDRLWRRCIEMFLLAGDYDNEGRLPSIEDIAWALRANPDELTGELEALATIGILNMKKDGDSWYVTKWVDRQGPVTGAERTKRHREWKRQEQYYGNDNVTKRHTDVDVDRDTDKEVDEDVEHTDNLPAQVFKAWEQVRGSLNSMDGEELRDMMGDYTGEWVLAGIQEANKSSKGPPSLKYLAAILQRWTREGFKAPFKKGYAKPDNAAISRANNEEASRRLKEMGL